MCGRYIIIDGRKIFATFDLLKELDKKKIPYMDIPRYNAAPMQKLPIVVQREDGIKPLEATWWLIPHWSKTGKPDTAFPSFNARADRIDTSKLFAPYFKSRRCLVPADGFYEWKKISDKEKQPMCIRMRQDDPFMMAGVFSIWKDEKEEEHPSFSIITTEPNSLMAGIHNRMPVILPEKSFEQWLDPAFNDVGELKKHLAPYSAEKMKAYPVSKYVSNSRNDGPQCMEEKKQ